MKRSETESTIVQVPEVGANKDEVFRRVLERGDGIWCGVQGAALPVGMTYIGQAVVHLGKCSSPPHRLEKGKMSAFHVCLGQDR